jgi:inhibitor of KinA
VSLLLDRSRPEGVVEWVPSYAAVTVYFDPRATTFDRVRSVLEGALARAEEVVLTPGEVVTLPVHYGGEWGPDLEFVAESHGMSPAEVVEEHARPLYLVHMIGFAPGFPYLGGLSERLATPRLETPRVSVPAGSVGIGGSQTGVYPLETPGGWRIIGRTPERLFDLARPRPNLLSPGDRVRFLPIEGS